MNRSLTFWMIVSCALSAAAIEKPVSFSHDIRPILSDRCFSCHGPDAKKRQADMRLDTPEALTGALPKHPELRAFVPGKPEAGEAWRRIISHDEKTMMPPPKSRKQLTDAERDLIRKWIVQGAKWEAHWAFAPLAKTAVPEISDAKRARNEVDRFILARLDDAGLKQAPEADRTKLIRRLTLDLTGVPPTVEEVDSFVADHSADAYDKVVDRLLSSPRHGERWARHWLDTARFAESHGFEQDYNRPYAFWYRDFVIRALNDNMPFDQFVRWQLAGDELAPDDPWAMAATGFLGAGQFPTQLTEAEFEQARYDELDNMTSTTGSAMLGLSIGCARCHDHKFDPITAKEYYQFASFFTTTIRSEIDLNFPASESGKAAGTSKLASNSVNKVMVTSEGFKPMKHHADGRGFPHFYTNTFFLTRGDVKQKGEVMTPGFPHALARGEDGGQSFITPPPTGSRTSHRREALAKWITDVDKGSGALLARVEVNRIWQHHFGRGIVSTPNDFGMQGAQPTHPELLEWLAAELVSSGWDVKHIHKLIVTSATYRQQAREDELARAKDVDNELLWRWPVHRLEGESIRDAMLAVSGELDEKMYGPGTLDQSMKRRSIYFLIKRSELVPALQLFDLPEPNGSVGTRVTTTIAPQALSFVNSPQVRSYAKSFAKRITAPASTDFVTEAYRRALGRAPTESELRKSAAFLDGGDAESRIDFCQTVLSLNEFIYLE